MYRNGIKRIIDFILALCASFYLCYNSKKYNNIHLGVSYAIYQLQRKQKKRNC